MTTQHGQPPTAFKDYYAIMRLSTEASSADVHRKYRELVRECAMDSDGDVSPRLAEVNEAYRVLASSSFRREYDQIWATSMGGSASIFDEANEAHVPEVAPPPLAVMAKQQPRARAPKPATQPKSRFSIRRLLSKLGPSPSGRP